MGCACCTRCISVLKAVNGTYIWTCPSGVTSVFVQCWGAGGGGGGGQSTNGGQGGGGGGYSAAVVAVTPGNLYDLVAGAGGVAAPSQGFPGGNGGDSTFGQHSGVAMVTAGGGGAGYYAVNSGGAGGSGTTFNGGSGGNFYAGLGGGGGGGGCASSSGAGGAGSAGTLTAGGTHGNGASSNPTGTGDGGDGAGPGGNGFSGFPTGGGGGGAGANDLNSNPAGSGADGAVLVTSCVNLACCANALPVVLYATLGGANSTCTCANGMTIMLNYTVGDPVAAGWCPSFFPGDTEVGYFAGSAIVCGQTMKLGIFCNNTSGFFMCFDFCAVSGVLAADGSSFSCSPLYMHFTNFGTVSGCGTCTGPSFISITVTP